MTTLIFVVGATNSGKTTLLEAASKEWPRTTGLVEVGKMLRAKYPPSYFDGQAAPASTAEEAWEMMVSGIGACVREKKSFIYIDGQPRDVNQVERIVGSYYNAFAYRCRFLHLFAPAEIRELRACARDKTKESLELSLRRLQTEPAQLFEVLSRLHFSVGSSLVTVNTGAVNYSPIKAVERLLC
jgi:adenylate kinase family enzyme